MKVRKGQIVECRVRYYLDGEALSEPYTVFANVLSDATERKSGSCRMKALSYGQEFTVAVSDIIKTLPVVS